MSRSWPKLRRLRANPCVFPILIFLFSGGFCAASAGPQSAAVAIPHGSGDRGYDIASFAAELDRLDEALQGKPSADTIANLRQSLPATWAIHTPERSYSISTKPLYDQLNAPSILKAEIWIEHVQVEIESFQTNAPTSATARAALNKILAGSDFAGVRPPSALEILRQRIAAWFDRILYKLFGSISRHPVGGQILFWLLLTAGVAFVALWTFRFVSTRESKNSLKAMPSIASTRSWQEWVRAARQAATRGDFREAIHSTYWAGIAHLEEKGTLPRDRTKTPREYLRLLNAARSSETSSLQTHKEPLRTLTSRLERIWYANRVASSEDFNDSLRQLEALGCHLE